LHFFRYAIKTCFEEGGGDRQVEGLSCDITFLSMSVSTRENKSIVPLHDSLGHVISSNPSLLSYLSNMLQTHHIWRKVHRFAGVSFIRPSIVKKSSQIIISL
jgi:hypothetical protein